MIVFKEKPFELWDLKSCAMLRQMPRHFPKITALVRNIANSRICPFIVLHCKWVTLLLPCRTVVPEITRIVAAGTENCLVCNGTDYTACMPLIAIFGPHGFNIK